MLRRPHKLLTQVADRRALVDALVEITPHLALSVKHRPAHVCIRADMHEYKTQLWLPQSLTYTMMGPVHTVATQTQADMQSNRRCGAGMSKEKVSMHNSANRLG